MEVGAAADVVVLNGIRLRGDLGQEGLVQPVLEDRSDGSIAHGADGDAAAARGLQPDWAIAAGERENAEAGSEALLGMRLRLHDDAAQRGGGRADLLGRGEEARRRPEGVASMRTRHVLGDRGVASRYN